ncbi:hypothetical protein LINPERPRIM_LOCUS17362 [Linum perenne]
MFWLSVKLVGLRCIAAVLPSYTFHYVITNNYSYHILSSTNTKSVIYCLGYTKNRAILL